ncbi:MFS transporter [Croceicoccus mobilis]|uniref:MFS transporter n=1 Tax=Croceicoccus mobilis TaxID=1703339 RepID=A0A917DY73_9SPHN|nr:MFS transporter [Croceicoccus mobilis]GGD81417.1 MFS transporter [Croceicoccus mobilis]
MGGRRLLPGVYSAEFADNRGILGAAFLGLTASMPATMFYSMGAFMGPLEAEFGWPRDSLSFAVTLLTIGLFLSGPVAGRLSDSFGAARIAAGSTLLYGIMLIGLGFYLQSLVQLWIAYFVIAVVGVGSTPIVMVRPVAGAFDKHRGLAIGIALTGAGISGFWVPLAATGLIELGGWRTAFAGLGLSACVIAPLVYLGFRGAESDRGDRRETASTGMSFGEAACTMQFWALSTMAAFMALGVAGLVVHFVPMFREMGAAPYKAAGLASLIGISSVAGRIAVGWLLDRIPATLVSFTILALAAAGALLLYGFGLQFAVVAVLLLGLAAGAEIDLIAFLCARLFGQRAYGAIYGWHYSVFALGYGFSPLLAGRGRELTGSYDLTLVLSGFAILAAAFLAPLAGRRVAVTG